MTEQEFEKRVDEVFCSMIESFEWERSDVLIAACLKTMLAHVLLANENSKDVAISLIEKINLTTSSVEYAIRGTH